MTVNSSVKSVIFKDLPHESTAQSSFFENDYMVIRNRKPSVPENIAKQKASLSKNKLKVSRQGISLYDISASGDFGNGINPPNTNNKTVVKNNVSVTQLNTVNINPDPSKAIKASIGGEEFLMYRTSDLQQNQNIPNNVQHAEDDNDSVEIEMQDEEEFIHHTMKTANNSVCTKPQLFKKPVHKRQASRDVEYIELDMFEDYENKLQNFLKTTPYIDQLLETSKQYRMFMEYLKMLAAFNDELEHVLAKVRDLSKRGKEVRISRIKGQNILKKNRELRVHLKSLINDNGLNTNTN